MKHFNMKTGIRKITALAMIMLSVCQVWAFDFSDVSSSGHRLFYTIVSDVEPRTVKLVAPNSLSWNEHTKPTGNVVVPQTVTYGQNTYTVVGLDNRCFNECNGIITINLPSTIDRIDEFAFYGCYGLTSIAMPNSVKSIGANAFYYCRALQSITLPDSLSCIENDLFHYCDSLRSITIPPYVDSIKSSAFYSSGLTSITIPSSVTFIGSYAFAYTNRLTSISLPSSIRCIQQYAFEGSAYYNNSANWMDSTLYISNHLIKMNKVVSGGTLVLPAGTIGIADNAIANADYIETISLPASLKYIGNNAFFNAYILSSVNLPNGLERIGNRAFDGCLVLENVSFGSSLKHIGEYAFNNCNFLTSVEIPYSLQTIGGHTFETCDNLDTVRWNAPNLKKINSNNTSTFSDLFNQCNNITLIFGDSVRTIPANAFNGCTNIYTLCFPNTLRYIGDHAFNNCDSIRYVEIPYSVTSVGNEVFRSCDSLHTVVWNSNSLNSSSFSHSPNIKNFVFGDSVRTIPANALSGRTQLQHVTIGNNVDSIGSYAFSECTNMVIDSLRFPNTLRYIGYRAFNNCDSIRYVEIPYSVTSVVNEAFIDCDSLHTVVWNSNSWKSDLFSSTTNIKNFVFGDSVRTIPANALSYRTQLQHVTIGNNVDSIGASAFSGCTNIVIDSLRFPNTLEYIGASAFNNCDSIRYVEIPYSVTVVGGSAFGNCDSLNTIVWNSNSWNGTAFNGTPIIKILVFGDSVRVIPNYAFYDNRTNIQSVVIGNNVDSIGAYAFYDCTNMVIDSLRFPNIRYIGALAFYGCTNMVIDSLRFPNSLKYIGGSAFYDCDSIRYVEIPYSVTVVGGSAFENCDSLNTVVWNAANVRTESFDGYSHPFRGCLNLKNVVFGDSVRTIPANVLSNHAQLQHVTIGNNVDSIGASAFSYCRNMVIDSLRFPNSLKYIGGSAFQGCTNMVIDSLRFPNSLKYIGGSAFYNCDSIRYVEVPHTVDTVLPDAFSYCDNLHTVVWNCPSTRLNNFYRTHGMQYTNLGIFKFCNIRNFVFGDSIRIIESGALYRFENIRSVTLGDNINRIDVGYFPVCDTIISRNITPPYLYTSGYNSYEEDLPVDAVVIVPCESVSAYRNSSWNYFTNIVGSELGNSSFNFTVNNDSYGNVNYDCSNRQLSATSNYGYHFVRWSDGNTTNPRIIYNINNLSLEAIFAKNTYTISFSDTTKGIFTGGGMHEYLDTITISAAARYGYTFAHWSNGDTNATRQVVVRENKQYVANFNPIIYNITVVSNNTAMGTVSGGGALPYNSTCTITATPASNQYYLLQWSDGNTDNPRTVTVLGNATYEAIFALKPTYTITVTSGNPDWGTVTGSGSNLHGTNVTMAATANYGYHFARWSDGNTQNPRTIRLERDTVFTAIFERNTYTLTVDVNDSERGNIYGGGNYFYKDTITISATANYGYHFTRWSDGNTDNPRMIQITGNTTVTAIFDKNIYTLSGSVNIEGAGYMLGLGQYAYQEIARVRAVAEYGYDFVRFRGSMGNDRITEIKILSDTIVIAEFNPKRYLILCQTSDSERGWVNGQGSYEYKDTAVLQANSHYGYHFAYWDDDYSNDNPRKVEVIGNMTYTAYFEPNTYNVSLSSTDTNMGTVAGGGSYDYTSEAVIRANSKSGYFFSHWSDGGKSNPRVITIDRDITLTAHFTDTYVSIEEATEKLENLNFKPNPTDGIITFNTDEILKVEVLDVAGRLVAVYENTNVIDLSKINKGYYTLRITTAEGVAIRKVIRK